MRSGIRTTFAFAGTALLLSLLFALPRAASAEEPRVLYATAEAGTMLVAANLEAQRVSGIGATGFPFSLALAICPAEGHDEQEGQDRQKGVAYTITNTFDQTAQLATLNLGTGAATRVGSPLGQALGIMGMTCSPDGTLYAVGQPNQSDPDFNSLYSVDRKTGLASRIGSLGVSGGFLMALAFAPDGMLYGVNVSTLFRIDRFTRKATKVVDFVGVASVMGLAIDEDGKFHIADFVGTESKIYKLDLHTGLATPILKTGRQFVHNIAFKPHDGKSRGDR